MKNFVKNFLNKISKLDNSVKFYENASNKVFLPSYSFVNLGIALTELGEYKMAYETFKTSSNMANACSNAHINYGISNLQAGNYDEAIKNFYDAIDIDKTNPKPYILLGFTLSENGDYDKAFMFYEKAKKLNPKNPLLYLKWGITFLQLNKPSDAIECFNLSYQYDNENTVALFLLSVTQAEIGLFKSAYQNLKMLLNVAPNHFDAINIISYCALKT